MSVGGSNVVHVGDITKFNLQVILFQGYLRQVRHSVSDPIGDMACYDNPPNGGSLRTMPFKPPLVTHQLPYNGVRPFADFQLDDYHATLCINGQDIDSANSCLILDAVFSFIVAVKLKSGLDSPSYQEVSQMASPRNTRFSLRFWGIVQTY